MRIFQFCPFYAFEPSVRTQANRAVPMDDRELHTDSSSFSQTTQLTCFSPFLTAIFPKRVYIKPH